MEAAVYYNCTLPIWNMTNNKNYFYFAKDYHGKSTIFSVILRSPTFSPPPTNTTSAGCPTQSLLGSCTIKAQTSVNHIHRVATVSTQLRPAFGAEQGLSCFKKGWKSYTRARTHADRSRVCWEPITIEEELTGVEPVTVGAAGQMHSCVHARVFGIFLYLFLQPAARKILLLAPETLPEICQPSASRSSSTIFIVHNQCA